MKVVAGKLAEALERGASSFTLASYLPAADTVPTFS